MCKRLFFSRFNGHVPWGDEHFPQQIERGQKSRLLDSFPFNWPTGWPRQHLVKFKASIIPWFICSNDHKLNANEAVGTLFERVFAPNEIWFVTSAGEVQPELCTHQMWDLRLRGSLNCTERSNLYHPERGGGEFPLAPASDCYITIRKNHLQHSYWENRILSVALQSSCCLQGLRWKISWVSATKNTKLIWIKTQNGKWNVSTRRRSFNIHK